MKAQFKQMMYLKNHDAIMLLNTSKGGKDCYAYMHIAKNNLDNIMKAKIGGFDIDYEKFGKILMWGFGEPSEQVAQYITETYLKTKN